MKRIDHAAMLLAFLVLASPAAATAAQSAEHRSLDELRLTVVNLLQGLVERGVLSRDAAESMVREAQERAAADASAAAALAKAEEDAVRVTYVPEIVREEIRKQVVQDLTAEVTREVVDQARTEEWGVPAALPDWVRRVRWSGDVRFRTQADIYAEDNVRNAYLDFVAVNDAGGIGRAGVDALLNTTEDRERLRLRLRLGLDAELGSGWSVGARFTTGDVRNPVSANQTLGRYFNGYGTRIDLAYLRWSGDFAAGRHALDVSGGRIPNPWYATSMTWDTDVTFEGVAANYRLGLKAADPRSSFAFLTLGAFQLEELELVKEDKWLLGTQIGLQWQSGGGSRLRIGAAYYDYRETAGRRNELDSNLLDFTAPRFLQRGNTLFDIRNDVDPSTNLFALASDYRIATATAGFEWRLSTDYSATIVAEYVRNVGFDAAQVASLVGSTIEARDEGYTAEVGFGWGAMARGGAWRGFLGYRYLERDAALDAFTDSDFRLGGTDVKGFYLGAEYALTERMLARLRYLSANEIDGPPLGIDVVQLDLNARF